MPPKQSFEDRVATRLYELYKKRHGNPGRQFFPAVRRQLGILKREVKHEDEVELVALLLLEKDGVGFSAGSSLNLGSYDLVKRQAGVPEEAWHWALIKYGLKPGKIRRSMEYWLGVWVDAEAQNEEDVVYEAKQFLKLLEGRQQQMEMTL